MFLNEILDEYRDSDEVRKKEILNNFLELLWKSKCKYKKYRKYSTYKVNEKALNYREDLINLFNKFNKLEYTVCKSYYKNKLDSIDYIRIHINNIYGYLFDEDVYYAKEYYNLLFTPKKEYFKTINLIKNNCDFDINDVKNNIENAIKKAEEIKQKSINKKIKMKWSDYKKLVNSFIEKIFNNYMTIEEYEEKYGWDIRIDIDGWSEDNYIIKYFCKSLTGYFRNYIRKFRGFKYNDKIIHCIQCGIPIKQTSNRRKYCKNCWKEKELERQRKKWHKYKNKYRPATALENPANLHEIQ